MSQKLCEECVKKWDEFMNLGGNDELFNMPYIHCHHEVEKKECGDCKNWKTYFDLSKADAKYCPKCGRNYEPEDEGIAQTSPLQPVGVPIKKERK